MPHFRLVTNLSRDKIPKNFLKELTTVLSKTVGKPEDKFVVHIATDQLMCYSGNSDEPCATGFLMSIGHLGPTANIAHSQAIFEKISKDLGIKKERMLIEFKDAQPFEIGYKGTTVEILGA